MLYRVLYVTFNFFTLFAFIFGESIISKNEKFPELELQTCVDSFVIHKDKIIRTLDSQEMGAKYLTEIDVNSENECIKFCCVTDECDVFIFEEKKPGSCYLFHCGPPQDFKCKFTDHANYSSAVLTNYKPQSSLRLEEQIRKTPEHELKSLRKQQAIPGLKEYSYNESPAIAVTQIITKATSLTSPLPVKIECSRNQFECRTTGDCIAIYNVCDGIPQCPDGSDEAADLHCPTEKPSPSPPPVVLQKALVPPLPDVLKYQQMLQHHKSYAPLYGHVQENNAKSWPASGSFHQASPSQQQNLPYLVDSENVPQPNVPLFGSQSYPWNYQPYYDQNKESLSGYNYQNNLPIYEQQSHIFNHKRPGVVEEASQDGGAYANQNRPYLPYYQQSNHESWQEKQPQPHPSVSLPEQQIKSQVVQQKLKITTTPEPCKDSEKKTNTTSNSDIIVEINNFKKTTVDKSLSKNENLSEAKSTEKGDSNIKIIQIDKGADSKIDHKVLQDNLKETKKESLVVQHFRYNSSVNENLRPKGAVISLVLGLSVSAVMAILIACRLRVVRRRGRRGHEPYAHDADYLVNGMYL